MGLRDRFFRTKATNPVDEDGAQFLPRHLEQKLLGRYAYHNGQRTETSPYESKQKCSLCCKTIHPSKCTATLKEFRRRANRGCLGCTLIVSAYQRAAQKYFEDSNDLVATISSENDQNIRITASIQDHSPKNLFICVSSSLGFSEERFSIFTTMAPELSGLQLPRLNICSENASSTNSLETITGWIQACDLHPACSPRTAAKSLPTRLLDVSAGKVKLTSGSKSSGPYCALSHCWGDQDFLCTTIANLEAHHQGIEEDRLSRSFRDAINLTRYLDIRYLWIDSLCIVQKDDDDWARESAKMAAVYEDAYLVIAATGAKHGGIGCFTDRKTSKSSPAIEIGLRSGRSAPIYLYNQPNHEPFVVLTEDHSETPLLKRAWVFQERILSRRIIHFATNELVWECRTHARCECGYLANWDVSRYIKTQCARQAQPDRLLTMWYRLLAVYSLLDLTRISDRLPAISGFVEHLQSRGCGEYVAGLWLQDIFRGLLWSVDCNLAEKSRGSGWRAPSWSWACIEGTKFVVDDAIDNEKLRPSGKTPTGQDFRAQLVSVEQFEPTISTGVIKTVNLTLSAPAIITSIVATPTDTQKWTICKGKMRHKYHSKATVRFDCPQDDFKEITPTLLLWIGTTWMPMGPDDEFDCEYATYYLILQPSRGLHNRPPSQGCYERVGIIIDCDKSLAHWFDDAEIQIVTIV